MKINLTLFNFKNSFYCWKILIITAMLFLIQIKSQNVIRNPNFFPLGGYVEGGFYRNVTYWKAYYDGIQFPFYVSKWTQHGIEIPTTLLLLQMNQNRIYSQQFIVSIHGSYQLSFLAKGLRPVFNSTITFQINQQTKLAIIPPRTVAQQAIVVGQFILASGEAKLYFKQVSLQDKIKGVLMSNVQIQLKRQMQAQRLEGAFSQQFLNKTNKEKESP